MTTPPVETGPRRGAGPVIASVVAALAMIFIGWIYSVSGLFMPAWAVVGLLLVWVALVWFGVQLARLRSYVVLTVPAFAGGLWFLVAWLGETLLGWTA